ncbi:leucine-rich repeat-containing protein 24 [Zootermopsis nevadensis]|uniref:leucine-rich repeat-containing protein 24 n=1 Tax=Zootermopsis nevadensis TaxID=136037 RepID=UPI000B8EDC9E|nr:leucine-rich repeat-containing protein 24 [Zootermopsis nevadensis]
MRCVFSMMVLIEVTVTVVVLSATVTATEDHCRTVCSCIWKGGKQTVECINRGLITIPEKVHPETQVLDMSGNILNNLPRDMFVRAKLLNLQKVFFSNCRIGQIDDKALHGLTNLVDLDLSLNLLTSIPSETFSDAPLLRDVILAHNPIQKIENYAFRTLPSLVKLDLSHCEIQSIAPKAFEGLEHLESLKLNGNQLSELRPRTVETLNGLRGIELHDNPWLCDCHLRAVKEWLMKNNVPYPVAPVCYGGPERIADRTFAELDIDDFACKPEILKGSRYIEATTGENATVVCRVRAKPPAVINWYWNGRLLLHNSAFSSHQRVFIYENGQSEKSNTLVLTNAQETDSSEFYCVAENRAGNAEANFTLHVSLRTAGMATLGSGQIAGLSAALVILILFILLIILVLLVRLRRPPFSDSKTPGQIETSAAIAEAANNTTCKPSSIGTAANSDTSISEHKVVSNDLKVACNPVQKPPRMTELAYTTSHYDGKGSLINATQCFTAPSSGPPANNPDLIKDTKRLANAGELPAAGVVQVPNGHAQQPEAGDVVADETGIPIELRPGSGEYSRATGCDSLYPSGLWEQPQQSSLDPSPDLFIRRTTSSLTAGFGFDTTDRTPIIGDGTSLGGVSTEDEEYTCRTLPRPLHHHHHNGYPADYGLPIIPTGVDQKLREVGAVQHSPSSMSPTSATGAPPNAKTLRVWQRGVPVLPPVTALKRVLSGSRNSPDEGYQEGCGTDV